MYNKGISNLLNFILFFYRYKYVLKHVSLYAQNTSFTRDLYVSFTGEKHIIYIHVFVRILHKYLIGYISNKYHNSHSRSCFHIMNTLNKALRLVEIICAKGIARVIDSKFNQLCGGCKEYEQ